MSLKVNENLYIATNELQHIIAEPNDNGWKKVLVNQLKDYGLFYSSNGLNGKVIKVDNESLYVDLVSGVSSVGDVFSLRNRVDIPVSLTGVYHWIYATPFKSQDEKGTLSINSDGEIFGSSTTEFMSKLRGGDLATRIEFTNSSLNPGQFDVVSVSSDSVAVLNGVGFTPESGLTYKVIGTYDPLINTIGFDSQYEYDDCKIQVLTTSSLSALPTTPPSNSLLLGVAYNISGELVIEDRRDKWFTTENKVKSSIDGQAHILGVESAKWDSVYSPGNENIVRVSWALRSRMWSINYSDNTIIISEASGGIVNSSNFTAFYEGFVGSRVYNENGSYAIVISSTVSGGTIRLQMTSLPTDLFVPGYEILVTPNFDFIQLQAKDNFVGNTFSEEENTYAINTPYLDLRLPVKGETWPYICKYKLIKDGVSTAYKFFPTNELGFIKEESFDSVYDTTTITRRPYSDGTVVLVNNPGGYKNTISSIVTGEKFGLGRTEIIGGTNLYPFTVGNQYKDQLLYTTTTVVLGINYYINLKTFLADGVTRPRNGVEFNFDVTGDYLLGNYKIVFTQDYVDSGSTGTTVFTVDKFYAAQAKDGTFRLKFIFDGSNWVCQESNSFSEKKFDQSVQRFYPSSFKLGSTEYITDGNGVIVNLDNARITGNVFAWDGTTSNMPNGIASAYVECIFSPNLEGVQTLKSQDDGAIWQRFYKNVGGLGTFDWTDWALVYAPEESWVGLGGVYESATVYYTNHYDPWSTSSSSGDIVAGKYPSDLFVKRKPDGTVVFKGGFIARLDQPSTASSYNAMINFSSLGMVKFRPATGSPETQITPLQVSPIRVAVDGSGFAFFDRSPNEDTLNNLSKKMTAHYNHQDNKMYFNNMRYGSGLTSTSGLYFDLTGLTYQGN